MLANLPETPAAIHWVAEAINLLGLPIALLLLIGISILKISKWAAPRIELLFQKQVEFVDSAAEKLQDVSNSMANCSRANQQMRDELNQNTQATRELSGAVRELKTTLNGG